MPQKAIFTVRLHIMQRTVLLSQFCPCVQQWLKGDAPFPLKSALSDPPRLKNADFDSAHNVSTVGDSEKSPTTTNIKSITSFPTSHTWSTYVTHKSPKGWLKERFFRSLSKSQRLIVLDAVNLVRR